MLSSRDAACTWSPLQTAQRANHFSFPPTQRYGLLVSTDHSGNQRSHDQRANLSRTWNNVRLALSERPLEHAYSALEARQTVA